jgi:hypothetical protein
LALKSTKTFAWPRRPLDCSPPDQLIQELVEFTTAKSGQGDQPSPPVALNCFRPKDLRERLKIQDNLETGLPKEMKLDTPSETNNRAYSITQSIGKLELESCGLDNPFRIMTSPTTKIYFLLENWGAVLITDVKYWCSQLDNTGRTFDSENLCLSAMKIKGSLGAASLVATVMEADTPGPVLSKVAVDQVALLSAAKVRKFTTDLQGLSLKSVAAQSVDLCSIIPKISQRMRNQTLPLLLRLVPHWRPKPTSVSLTPHSTLASWV